ncbi:hypothetical protein LJC55_03285 [Eubacteriales bacterium OttesenSCG-928-N14]|nr:hypothetical protein [Eubacteriales bacterium OttesenSCG-928-N14]
MKQYKNRLFFTAFLALLLLVLAACGPSGDAGDGNKDNGGDKTETVLVPGTDMGIQVNGKWFPIFEDAEGLLAALGDGYNKVESPSCVFEGMDKVFEYPHCEVYTNPNGEQDIWYDIVLLDDTLSTSRGIKVGDSVDAVKAAYGEKFYWEGEEILTYSVSGIEGDIDSDCIQFTIVDDVVKRIEIYHPTNTI